MLFAIWGTTTKLSSALAIGIAFPLLNLFGFAAGADNSPDAILALGILYGAPCIGFKLLALYNMRRYPITKSVHQKILEKSQAITCPMSFSATRPQI